MERQWWKEAVVYQIYPRSFQDSDGDGIGDIPGIISRLDYIKELGADVIWLSPVYASPDKDNGYDISDYREIHKDFGTMADFDRLLEEAHRRGIKIVMDLVANHTSDQHPWFIESRSSRDNPKRDWYLWRDGHNGAEPNGLRSIFSGSGWQLDETTGQYYLHLFVKEQPDLNWDNTAVRESVYETMEWWLDKGIDGFRMDVINMISKPDAALAADGGPGVSCANGPRVHEYLQEMNRKVLSRYDIMTVGETSKVTVEDAKKYAGFNREELNMVFQFELMEADYNEHYKWNPHRIPLKTIREIMSKWQYGLDGVAWNSLYWNNHDQPRAVSRFGDTSTELLREKSAKMLAVCLHMMQGTPYIYQGEELGMTNAPMESLEHYRDVEIFNAYREKVTEQGAFTHDEMMEYIRKSGRDNARTPMQWDGGPNAGFTAGTPWITVNPNYREINAAGQTDDPNSIFSFYRELIRLRKSYPVIVYGSYELVLPEDTAVYAYRRRRGDAVLLVLCNFTGQPADGPDISALTAGAGELLIGNYGDSSDSGEALRPYEARVYLASVK
ncbi:alpha-glucosidase [Breznakiella homolactica]|uniref:Alpha-glucosidase n=1 Tax=Breznakiella homolactica TaxID=2798577 RepID=A0A7T7XQF3_9SPIR|nr:alpha-glucosidase [Breznakiella homolactica]QQO10583.1 alpha-glucosidase [Breznakiella homolactica]